MRIVKRYSNRKLYDTAMKRYVRLQDLARIVREGQEVRVVDNVTNDDLTTVTLSRVLLEKEKRRKRPLPPELFASLLRPGPGGARPGEMLRTIERLRARVASLERRLALLGR